MKVSMYECIFNIYWYYSVYVVAKVYWRIKYTLAPKFDADVSQSSNLEANVYSNSKCGG